jgi:hypothetical protein
MLGVSRRTVHYWSNGAQLTSAHERRLRQLSEIIGGQMVAPEGLRAALRSSIAGRSLIEIIAMGASTSLIRAHLSALLRPETGFVGQAPPPLARIPARMADPRRVEVRSLLADGASPAVSDDETEGVAQ